MRGTQVPLPSILRLGEESFLLNTRSELAHLATVALDQERRGGIVFVRGSRRDSSSPYGIPLEALSDAKFQQIGALIDCVISVAAASSVVGLTQDYLERCVKRGAFDEKREFLFHQARIARKD